MNRLKLFWCYLVFALVLFGSVPSVGAQDESSEALIRDLEANIIAPCCWSQPVSQHYSEVSDQIRKEIRAMVAEGKSRDEIMDFYVAKYGERILATPRPQGFNVLAYILPWAALLLGAGLLFMLIKRLRAPAPAKGAAATPDPRYSSIVEKEMKEFED
jgi:cytochrome c-type biogenesis protein CcmH